MLDYVSGGRLEVNGFAFEETEHRRPFEMEAHEHAQAHFALILSGHVDNQCGLDESLTGPGTFSYMPPECRHKTAYRTPVKAFYVAVHPPALERIRRSTPLTQNFQTGPERGIAARLYDEYRRADASTPLMVEGLMLELYATMTRKGLPREPDSMPKWLRDARDLLHAEIGRALTASELAGRVGVHPVHLMRSFRRQFGQTVGSYSRALRIDLACQRLAKWDEDSSLGALAQDLGFSDQSQFNRVFREATGMTPGRFREQGYAKPKEG